MTSNGPATAESWAVSTRSNGSVPTAGVSLPGIQLGILGIPHGFTTPEIQSWLRDLAGVALETSRTDLRPRPIPPLLHHSLTGLLFSQTELWSRTGLAMPCSAVFVSGPEGLAFGWVGDARVSIVADDRVLEPRWVIVRDESGQQACSAMLPVDAAITVTIECHMAGAGEPTAAFEASWTPASPRRSAPAPDPLVPSDPLAGARDLPPLDTLGAAEALSPDAVTPLVSAPRALPAELPVDQPGLASLGGAPVEEPTTVADSSAIRSLDDSSAAPEPAIDSPAPQAPSAVWGPSTEPIPPPELRSPRMPTAPVVDGTVAPSPSVEDVVEAIDVVVEPGPTEAVVGSVEPVATEDVVAPVASATVEQRPIGATEEVVGSSSESESAARTSDDEAAPAAHPVGRWLSRLMGIARRPAPQPIAATEPVVPPADAVTPAPSLEASEPSVEPVSSRVPEVAPTPSTPHVVDSTAPVSTYDAILSEPTPPPVVAENVAPLSDALQESLDLTTPAVASPVRSGRLVPVGIAEILGARRAGARPASAPASESALASESTPATAPTDASVSTAASRTHASEAAHPVLQVTPPTDRLDHPVTIEHEPVGAHDTFGIAPFTPREPAPSVPAPIVRPEPEVASVPTVEESVAEPDSVSEPDPTAEASSVKAAVVIEPETMVVESSVEPEVVSEPETIEPVVSASVTEPVAIEESSASAQATVVDSAATPAPEPEPVVAPPARTRPVLRTVEDDEPPVRTRPRVASWPVPGEDPDLPETPLWRRPGMIAGCVLALVGVGWFVGHSQAPGDEVDATPVSRALRAIGLGGARFQVRVDSDPPGAWIAVDGRDLARRTPATVELAPGPHRLSLSLPELGAHEVTVTGKRGERLTLDESLHGSLDVLAVDASIPVRVSLDGQAQGFLPVHVAKLPPGLHTLQFSGPNMQPWAQTVSVPIRRLKTLVAQPMMTSATGVLEVQAMMNDDTGASPMKGVSVYVDGELRRTTPLKLDLPRGPHSLRAVWRGETAPVQVIDLPGGNRPFATFQFGLDSDLPSLRLMGRYATLPANVLPLTESLKETVERFLPYWHQEIAPTIKS
ncbi:MAG: PEGA domain-containing protein, partial [bacterium]